MITQRQLTQAAQENWIANHTDELAPEVRRDLGYDTAESLPDTIERVMGEEATERTTQLELVPDDGSTAEADTSQATKYKPSRPARTPREKLEADQGRRLELKPPPEWTPYLFALAGSSEPVDKSSS